MLARSPVAAKPGPSCTGDDSARTEGYSKFVKLISDRQNGQIPTYTLRIYCIVCMER
jgi:hypothetical protein